MPIKHQLVVDSRGRVSRLTHRAGSFWACLAVLASAGAYAEGLPSAPGVTDLTLASADLIRTSDIIEALSPSRGTRVQAVAPPTLLLPVLFQFDSATLRPEAKVLLAKVHESITSSELQAFDFLLEGHTDDVGQAGYNRSLAARRAASVRWFLVSRGVAPDRLATIGFGESRPVATNRSEEGRMRNRRVVFVNRGRAS